MNRWLKKQFCFLLFILTAFTCSLSFATPPLDSLSTMLKSVMPAVVNIKAIIKITDYQTLRRLQKERGINPDDNNGQPVSDTVVSVGSGVIIDAKSGFIITNAHVINDAQSITITLSDGRHFTAKAVGVDKPSDVALLQIKAKNLTAIAFGDSNTLKVGDFVAAIGSPFGLTQSVTSGIVSAIGRTTLGIESYENFIQTDAPINPGNSGGALINMQGQFIGMNTAIIAPSQGSVGIGFAIPANMVKSVIQQLIEFGNVKRGVLGIGAQDITPDLAEAFKLDISNGAAVTQVLKGSPAEQSGLQVGDVITSVNDSPIKNASDVVNTVGFLRVDSKVKIDVLRQNKPITVTTTLSDPKKRQELIQQRDPYLYGVTLKNFTLDSPSIGAIKGILVVSVDQDSNAWNSDLRPGDVITSANQEKVFNIEGLKAAAAKADKSILLNVLRGPGAIFLVLSKES